MPRLAVVLARRIRWFVAATITNNVVEAVVAITAGSIASSSAVIGFGLDSVIEVASGAAVAWQFAAPRPEKREKTALRIIAFSFFGLAAHVTVDAVRALFGVGEAAPSTVGLVLAALNLVIVPFLSYAQRRTGRELGSRSAVADSQQTLLCTYLSGVLLAPRVSTRTSSGRPRPTGPVLPRSTTCTSGMSPPACRFVVSGPSQPIHLMSEPSARRPAAA